MIACALYPRFSLLAAIGDTAELVGSPVALAPEPGGRQAIGEVSDSDPIDALDYSSHPD